MTKQLTNLGKQFIQEFGLESSTDTFSRWMAHYLAEKMTEAETATGKKKHNAQKECFIIILQLWKHRWTVPHGKRPLENFEPLLNFLQKLNPDKDEPYFFPDIPTKVRGRSGKNPMKNPMDSWINMATELDAASRIMLNDILHQAAKTAATPTAKEWLENAVHVPESHDRQILQIIIKDNWSEDDEEEPHEDLQKKYRAENLKRRIDALEKFSKLSNFLLRSYKTELSEIETE